MDSFTQFCCRRFVLCFLRLVFLEHQKNKSFESFTRLSRASVIARICSLFYVLWIFDYLQFLFKPIYAYQAYMFMYGIIGVCDMLSSTLFCNSLVVGVVGVSFWLMTLSCVFSSVFVFINYMIRTIEAGTQCNTHDSNIQIFSHQLSNNNKKPLKILWEWKNIAHLF